MNNVFLEVRLDTPLLQGGAKSGTVDPLGHLRAESLRGLLHTWARAIIAPLVRQNNTQRIREAEQHLFGYAANDTEESEDDEAQRSSGFATFRLHDVTDASATAIQLSQMGKGPFPICPHNTAKGSREGHPWSITRQLRVSFRHDALEHDAGLVKALWSIVWIAFAFGSLGQRARRGYGSMTLVKVDGLKESQKSSLNAFEQIPERSDLEEQLRSGFLCAQSNMREWLESKGIPCVVQGHIQADSHEFFQLASFEQVRAGAAKSIGNDMRTGILYDLMHACSANHGGANYGRFLGDHTPRRASPLWVRIYKLDDGQHVPVAVYSSPQAGVPPLVNSVLGPVGITY